MPGRSLLILILIVIAVLAFRRLKESASRQNMKKKTRTKTGQMVQCAACGLYLPEREAIHHQGKYYCSPSHRDEHAP